MPRIDYDEVKETEANILAEVTAAGGITEADIAANTGLERRTVNNYLHSLQEQFRVKKINMKWYLAKDDVAVRKISKQELKLLDAIDAMLADGIELKDALRYLSVNKATYNAAVCYRDVADRMVIANTKQKSWFIGFSDVGIAVVIPAESGISRKRLQSKTAKEILPNALHFGVDDAIKMWLRIMAEKALT